MSSKEYMQHYRKQNRGKLRKYNMDYYIKNRKIQLEKRRKYDKNRNQQINQSSAKYRKSEKYKISRKKYLDNNNLKIKARQILNTAVKAGKIISPKTLKCYLCGNPSVEYDHHNGYEKEHWFDVIPICKNCHIKRTAEEVRLARIRDLKDVIDIDGIKFIKILKVKEAVINFNSTKGIWLEPAIQREAFVKLLKDLDE